MVAFRSAGKQEDIYVVHPDGTGLRKVTDDPFDRFPQWTPDGSQISFYSNRTGKYEDWSIHPDGSGLRQLTDVKEQSAAGLLWFSDGKRAVADFDKGTVLIDFTGPLPIRKLDPFPPVGQNENHFYPFSLSPDDTMVLGLAAKLDGSRLPGIFVCSLKTRTYEKLIDLGSEFDDSSYTWLNDDRRLLFVYHRKIFLLDRASKKMTEVYTPSPGTFVDGIALSKDNRTIYLNHTTSEADIWLLTSQ